MAGCSIAAASMPKRSPVLERASQIAPQALVVRFHLGMAQFKSGQSAQARENLQAALQSKSVFAGADEARAALASIPSKG